jgi:multisubunit Na+/H+ antiporter MnhG subunit
VAFWNKLNANERLAGIGAIVVIVGFIVSLLGSYGFGANTLVLLGAIAVLVIYYLKYSPTQTMTWPAPIPTIVLAISAIAALLAILGVLPALGLLGGLGLYTLGAILTVIGAVIMVWGAWQEYQAMPKATPPTGGPQL